jgi:hypothetical protein
MRARTSSSTFERFLHIARLIAGDERLQIGCRAYYILGFATCGGPAFWAKSDPLGPK